MLEPFLHLQLFAHINGREFLAAFQTWYIQKDLPQLFKYWNHYESLETKEREADNLTLTDDKVPEMFNRFWDTGELSFTFDQDNMGMFGDWSEHWFDIRYTSLEVFFLGACRIDREIATEIDPTDPPLINMTIETLGRCSVAAEDV
ncbi:hypothetical protein ACHAPX_010541 [Trichoderma viride]